MTETMNINNLDELQAEIIRLKLLSGEQGQALAARFKSPSAIFSTVNSLFRHPDEAEGHTGHTDLISLASRLLIPFTLNKTLFAGSGFLVKTLVTLVAQKASPYVNEASVHQVFDTGKAFISKLFHPTANKNL